MTELSIGTPAPQFTALDQEGKHVSLNDFAGKNVILYFYPKDNTPGCTTEACDFRDHFSQFSDHNTVIIGVSKDSVKSHQNFAQKYDLPFTLISDESTEICQAYGVWQEKNLMGKKYMGIVRTTFHIDAQGMIAHVWRNVKVKDHIKHVLQEISA